jgi:hypothetical protein
MPEFLHDENLELRYHPFPIGQIQSAVDEKLYDEMIAAWPALDLFEYKPELGHKYALSQKCHGKEYKAFVRGTPVWARFDQWIRSDAFVETLIGRLQSNHIDLGYRPGISWRRQTIKNMNAIVRGRPSNRGARLAASWEFQMMPASGGFLLPHTDAPSKIVTMTLSMLRPGEWDTSWGGGIDIGVAKDDRFAYNQLNAQADFGDLEWVDTFPFVRNTAVVFVKTYNSWHGVRPLHGPDDGTMRRNLVINICQR